MNKAILIGRLTKDAELRVTPSGVKVSSFTIAVDRGMSKESKAQAQQKGEPTADFINCVCFNKIAEFVATYCKKGNLVAVDGKIQTRSYDDKTGKKVYVTEVVVSNANKLDWGNDNKSSDDSWYTEVDTDDIIPF
jgi:single-strand DNA-binding protein